MEFDRFRNRDFKIEQQGYPFPVRSLMTWKVDSPAIVPHVIHGFKGGRSTRAASNFALLLASEGAFRRELRFIWPPSKDGGIDHASALGLSLRDLFKSRDSEVRLARVGEDRSQQRHRGRSERHEIRFELVGDPTKFTRQACWIFVDDVVTTGATAMAAYMALGDPSEFAVWTLACRPSLAGKEGL